MSEIKKYSDFKFAKKCTVCPEEQHLCEFVALWINNIIAYNLDCISFENIHQLSCKFKMKIVITSQQI